MLWQSREISPEGKWKVSDELHPVTQWNNICLGLPACMFDVSLSSPRTGRSEIVDYDGKLSSEKYWWIKGNFTNFRWTLSQLSWKILFPICAGKSPLHLKSALYKPEHSIRVTLRLLLRLTALKPCVHVQTLRSTMGLCVECRRS